MSSIFWTLVRRSAAAMVACKLGESPMETASLEGDVCSLLRNNEHTLHAKPWGPGIMHARCEFLEWSIMLT